MPDILDQIISTKAAEVAHRSSSLPIDELVDRSRSVSPPRGFVNAIESRIASHRPAVICEIKKASPSKGVIREDFDPGSIALSYARAGASCLSVLTDERYFQGHDRFIEEARAACPLPVLRKDFIIHPYQVHESRLIGADAILLIVAALDDHALHELAQLAHENRLDVLVEVHDAAELERALALPCRLIGVNNRNLRTFETSLETTLSLLESIPDDRVIVTESGIHSKYDVAVMRANRIHAFLVGETFMRAEDPGAKLVELFGSLQ